MPEAIWIDGEQATAELARRLQQPMRIAVDTEFLRERTFFPRLCLVQIAAGGEICCVDAIAGTLAALAPALTSPASCKLLHAARQDLEAIHVAIGRVVTPVFDTQVAAACVGLRPQIGYADLVSSLLGVTLDKAHTRTDWSMRPLSREQLAYAADDVRYLDEVARLLEERLRELGREHWVREDCAALGDVRRFEPDPDTAWERLRGIAELAPRARARAKALATWRERLARERNLPRSWILPDAAVFAIAHSAPTSPADLAALRSMPPRYNARFAEGLLAALRELSAAALPEDAEPGRDARPTDAQKAAIERLNRTVDARAAELAVSAEVLATRGQIKALAMGVREIDALAGWRRAEIGDRLLAALD
ncbi:MAG TPA: ribonuclease D [Steroidobacteraceae bacterium]|nr:ribonuclease D [Steroidobacteraceae bacterium]